jgi:hypothetical protein
MKPKLLDGGYVKWCCVRCGFVMEAPSEQLVEDVRTGRIASAKVTARGRRKVLTRWISKESFTSSG